MVFNTELKICNCKPGFKQLEKYCYKETDPEYVLFTETTQSDAGDSFVYRHMYNISSQTSEPGMDEKSNPMTFSNTEGWK